MSGNVDPKHDSRIFKPVTERLGKEGRRGATAAAKEILKKIEAAKPPLPIVADKAEAENSAG